LIEEYVIKPDQSVGRVKHAVVWASIGQTRNCLTVLHKIGFIRDRNGLGILNLDPSNLWNTISWSKSDSVCSFNSKVFVHLMDVMSFILNVSHQFVGDRHLSSIISDSVVQLGVIISKE
jgi:hypothetical protein